jgi:hypothetical protein
VPIFIFEKYRSSGDAWPIVLAYMGDYPIYRPSSIRKTQEAEISDEEPIPHRRNENPPPNLIPRKTGAIK